MENPIVKDLCEWLCKAPKCTTYRVNLLQTNAEVLKNQLEAELLKKYPNPPKVHISSQFPELVSVSNLHSVESQSCSPQEGLNEIIVDTSCGASILRGAHIYAPGVMAMRSGTKVGENVNVYTDIEAKCKKGTSAVYESAMKTFLGVGTVRMARYQLFGENIDPRGIAVEMDHTVSGVPSIGDLSSPTALLQNFPSIVCGRVLDPQPNETILDMCSAPGNKTTHLAELIKDSGVIIALDKTESKIELVRKKVSERNLESIKCFAFDSTKALAENTEISDITKGPPFPPESFDRILLDAPCSALGNRPLLSCNLNSKMLQSYPKVQRKLFKAAVGLLRKQGILVYSTCTIMESENEGIVRWALDSFPELRLIKADPIIGGSGVEGSELTDEERKLVHRFGPEGHNDPIDSVGFFIAKFYKG